MKIMSFNLLCGGKGLRDWEPRVDLVTDAIRAQMPDTLGVQEAHYDWMQTLVRALPEYAYVGVGRDDGKTKGEYSAVFYRKDKFSLLDSGSFWLSETPDRPGKGWDAACVRICSWAKLKDVSSGKCFVHFNTHLDHIGQTAMIEGARLVAQRSNELCPDLPSFFTGDFNVEPDSEPYRAVLAGGYRDARDAAPQRTNAPTFHWEVTASPKHEGPDSIIDYVFVKGDVKVLDFKVIEDMTADGRYPSDHFPVIAEVSF